MHLVGLLGYISQNTCSLNYDLSWMSLLNCGVLVPPMNAQSDSVGCSLVLGNATLRCAFASLCNELVFVIQLEEWFRVA